MTKEKHVERDWPVEAAVEETTAAEPVTITKADVKAGFVEIGEQKIRIGSPQRFMVTGNLADPAQFAAPQPEPYVDSPEEADRARKAAQANDVLAKSNPCTYDESCGLEFVRWSNRDHWSCEKCGYTGFSLEEATGRKPSVKTK